MSESEILKIFAEFETLDSDIFEEFEHLENLSLIQILKVLKALKHLKHLCLIHWKNL